MKKIMSLTFIVLAATISFSALTSTRAQEMKIKKSDLPAVVSKAFQAEYPNAKILGVAKETEKGVTYFEIESKDGKVRRDLLFTKNGKVAEIEESLTSKDIPVFVKKSIEMKFKNVEFKRGEKNIRNSVTKYEVVIEAAEIKYEVVCNASGKILKTTRLKDEESDND